MSSLPINAALPALLEALRERDEVVLQAPPGAGKTTRVPLVLLDEPWLQGQTIIMLEPRRLAARAAAERMAGELGEKVGETVGYRIRLDSKVGPKTRIEVVTEGSPENTSSLESSVRALRRLPIRLAACWFSSLARPKFVES